jgi:DNA-binding NarL/FixJ family response regulator
VPARESRSRYRAAVGRSWVREIGRVVIADDHDLVRAGLRSLLRGEPGLEVVGEAPNGRDAVALCKRVRPHVVFMDVRMPDMDGLAATRAVRRDSPTTSVILFTMYEAAEYVLDGLRAGAAGYVLKGASKDTILDAVRQVIAGREMLRGDEVLRLLQRTATAPRKPSDRRLTPRERDVLRFVALGQTNAQIGNVLGVSTSTVKTHVEHVIGKLGASDRTQAAVRAVELGLVAAGSP